MRNAFLAVLVSAFLSIAPGCGSTPEPPAPVVAQYQAKGGDVFTAYPSDRFTVADAATKTGLRVKLDAETTQDPAVLQFPQTFAQLNALDGFSTISGAFATFSGPLDVRGIAVDPKADPPDTTPLRDASDYTRPGAPMYLVDSDPRSPERGTLIGLVPKYWGQDKDLDYAASDYTLLAQPARPLRPATRYFFVITNALRGKSGAAVTPSADTTRLLASSVTPYDRAVADGLGLLKEKVGLPRASVALATSFTTSSVTGGVFGMAERARKTPVPALTAP